METNTDGNQDPNSPTEWPTIHEDLHSLVCDPTIGLFILGADHMNSHETHVTVTPLKVPHAPILSLFGTPTCRVGFFSTAGPSCIAGLWQRRMWSLRQKLGAQLLLGVSTSRAPTYGGQGCAGVDLEARHLFIP